MVFKNEMICLGFLDYMDGQEIYYSLPSKHFCYVLIINNYSPRVNILIVKSPKDARRYFYLKQKLYDLRYLPNNFFILLDKKEITNELLSLERFSENYARMEIKMSKLLRSF